MSPIQDVESPSGSVKLDALFKIANSRAFGSVILLMVLFVAWTWIADDREKTDKRFQEQISEIKDARKEISICSQNTILLLSDQMRENTETNKQILKYLEKNDK